MGNILIAPDEVRQASETKIYRDDNAKAHTDDNVAPSFHSRHWQRSHGNPKTE